MAVGRMEWLGRVLSESEKGFSLIDIAYLGITIIPAFRARRGVFGAARRRLMNGRGYSPRRSDRREGRDG